MKDGHALHNVMRCYCLECGKYQAYCLTCKINFAEQCIHNRQYDALKSGCDIRNCPDWVDHMCRYEGDVCRYNEC